MTRLVAVAAAFLVAMLFAPGQAVAATNGVPYQDPSAVGGIGLCDGSGHQITHGSLSAAPFVSRAVSAIPAAHGYDGAGKTATLFAYQPRVQTPAGNWSGQQLTASTRYTGPHPIAVGTARDSSLGAFLNAYPAELDHLVQLRIYNGAPGQPADTAQYAATDLRISGSMWSQVESVTVNCSAGSAVSIESILLRGTTHHAKNTAKPQAAKGSVASPAVSKAADIVPVAKHNSSSSTWIWLTIAGVCLGLLALTPFARRRRT